MLRVLIIFILSIFFFTNCATPGIKNKDNKDYHLRRLEISSSTNIKIDNYEKSKIRPILKDSGLFKGNLNNPSIDVKIILKSINQNTKGMIFTGHIEMLYIFKDVASNQVIFKALVKSKSNSTAADAGYRSKDLKRNLVLDNVELLTERLSANGIKRGKYVVYKGDMQSILSVIAMSPLYGITTVGIVGVETTKAVGNGIAEGLKHVDLKQMEIDDRNRRSMMYDAMYPNQKQFKRWEDMTNTERKNYIPKTTSSSTNERENKTNTQASSSNKKNTCYKIGNSDNSYPNQSVDFKNVLLSIGQYNQWHEKIVAKIELKFQGQGGGDRSLTIRRFEIVSYKSNSQCYLKSINQVYSDTKKKYNNWNGKHYYIKLIK